MVLLARRPLDASPDALHPGKAWENPRGKFTFPYGLFPGFLGPEALKLSVTPARQAELVCLSQLRYFASCGSRGIIPLVGSGVKPRRFFLVGIIATLEKDTLIY